MLHSKQKKVTTNMTATSPIQFGQNLLLAPTGVVLILTGELRVINTDPHNKKEKGLIPVLTPQGKTMWVHPNIVESQQWATITSRKSRGKAKASSRNMVSISTREIEKDFAFLTSSGDEESALVANTNAPPTSKTRSGKQYQPHSQLRRQSSSPRGYPWKSRKSFDILKLF